MPTTIASPTDLSKRQKSARRSQGGFGIFTSLNLLSNLVALINVLIMWLGFVGIRPALDKQKFIT